MLFDLEVRAQAGTPYFQPFKTTVEAGTSNDALNRVKRQYPDSDVWVTNSYNKQANRSSGGSGGAGVGGFLFLGVLVIIGGVFGAGGSNSTDSAPAPTPAPVERVAPAPTYQAPAPTWSAPERSYEAPSSAYDDGGVVGGFLANEDDSWGEED